LCYIPRLTTSLPTTQTIDVFLRKVKGKSNESHVNVNEQYKSQEKGGLIIELGKG